MASTAAPATPADSFIEEVTSVALVPQPPPSVPKKPYARDLVLAKHASNALNSRYSDMFKAFKYLDQDNSGTLDEKEIKRALQMWNIAYDDKKVKELIDATDHDGDGQVDYKEFVDALARDTVAPAAMGKRDMQSKDAMGVGAYDALDEQLGHGGKPKHASAMHGASTTIKSAPKDVKKQAMDAIASRFTDIRKAFKYVDIDNSGTLDEDEIKRALQMWNLDVDSETISRLMKQADANNNGQISYDEFVDALARDTVAPAAMNKRGLQSKDAMGVGAYEMLDQQLGHGNKVKHAYAINDNSATALVRTANAGDLQKQVTEAIANKFTDIKMAFRYFDVDNSGSVDEKEIKRALQMFNIPLDDESVKRIVDKCDANNNGQISYDEFVDALARDTVAPAAMNKRGLQSKEAMGVGAYDMLEQQLGHGNKVKHAYGQK